MEFFQEFFSTTKRGEMKKLKIYLSSNNNEKRKEAVKKLIIRTTEEQDDSVLLPDVLKSMRTDDLELKKLVYSYLMYYAKNKPDLAIKAVNTLVKDSEDMNPFIRALALRTLGSIKVDSITEHLCGPLRKCLEDKDSYVRKTAVVCVAKLYHMNPQFAEGQGFLDKLKDLFFDANPMVVANTVAALSEINEYTNTPLFEINGPTIGRLLTALKVCNEWGKVIILDTMSKYTPKDQKEAKNISKNVISYLAHSNSAIVLSTVKVLIKLLELFSTDPELHLSITNRLIPSLVTLLSSEPEIQYVALRNINIIVQKKPNNFKHELKVFFVKFNDPIFIKLEKLDIMVHFVSQTNISQVLSELKGYATDIDEDFVRKAVRAIGRCALKVEQGADRCVSTLLALIQTEVNCIVKEVIIVLRDIFRKYPNKYESIIFTLCENLDELDEPEAISSMIWMVGEYAEHIDNADELLVHFLKSFDDDNPQVQFQLLTAAIKLFLKKPNSTQGLVQQVLREATESDNPDLRDRGYIYWRLLSTDPVVAKNVVLAEKPLISEETDILEPSLLDQLIGQISSLASVYHQPPAAFIEGKLRKDGLTNEKTESTVQPSVINPSNPFLRDIQNMKFEASPLPVVVPESSKVEASNGGLNISLKDNPKATNSQFSAYTYKLIDEIFSPAKYHSPKVLLLEADKSKGLEFLGTFNRRHEQIFLDFILTNKATQVMEDFAIQVNKNCFGVIPSGTLQIPSPLLPGQSHEACLLLATTDVPQSMEPLNTLQVAIKNNIDIFYFACLMPAHVFFTEDGKMEKGLFLSTWKGIPAQNEVKFTLTNVMINVDTIMKRMEENNIFAIAKREVENKIMLYQSVKLVNQIWVLIELKITPDQSNITISLKIQAVEYANMIFESYSAILQS